MQDRIKLFMVDDHRLFREGLELVLERAPNIEVVGQARTGEEAVEKIANVDVDIVLLDLNLPGIDGIETCRRLKAARKDLRIVMLTITEDTTALFDSVKAGACGYLLKDIPSPDLLIALEQVYQEGGILDPTLARRMFMEFSHVQKTSRETDGALPELSPREKEILSLICAGKSNKEIGAALNISRFTVGNHVNNIFRKLNVNDRTQASVIAVRHHLVDVG